MWGTSLRWPPKERREGGLKVAFTMNDRKSKRRDAVLPASYVQRGVALPCTTPLLSYARLRATSGGNYDVLVPGLAGGGETYVIPINSLREVITLTVHDRALLEELRALRDLTPISIRSLAMRVGETGLAGPALVQRARFWRERETSDRPQIVVALIMEAIHQLAEGGLGADTLDKSKIATPEGLALAKKALSGYAASAQTTAETVFERLDTWAEIVLPVGAPDGSTMGYLQVLRTELETMADELTQWLVPEPPETAEMAQRTAVACREAAATAGRIVDRINAPARDMSEPLAAWSDTRKILKSDVLELAHVLDGWQRVRDFWYNIVDADRFAQRDTLERMAQHLPVLPAEATGVKPDVWQSLRESQERWSRTSEHGLRSELDQDTRDKLRHFRKEPV